MYLLGERVPPPCKPCSGRLLTVEAGKPQHLVGVRVSLSNFSVKTFLMRAPAFR